MKIRFWGSRGSIPSPLTCREVEEKIRRVLEIARGHDLSTPESIERFLRDAVPFHLRGTYGRETPCVQVVGGEASEHVLLDAGSGLRAFGNALLARGEAAPATYHILLSHLHWDHIQGFPFFTPAYIPGNRVVLHGHHEDLADGVARQFDTPNFPVPMSAMRASVEFQYRPPGESFQVGGLDVTSVASDHPGVAYAYRLEREGKALVYLTDAEHRTGVPGEDHIQICRGADVVIFDAMYTTADSWTGKESWGHGSNLVGVDLAALAGVRHLCLFHHDPVTSDEQVSKILADAKAYRDILPYGEGLPREVTAAYDGMEIDL